MSHKEYQIIEDAPLTANEPAAVYGAVRNAAPRTYVSDKSPRSNPERGITGEELLSRLRPRIKTLFT